LEGVLLTELSQAEKRFVTETEFSVAGVDNNLFDGLFHDVPLIWIGEWRTSGDLGIARAGGNRRGR
jgi:hypothetical protein